MSNSIVEAIEEFNKAVGRIQALEDRLEGQEALTANLEDKIKALEETVEYLEGKL